MLEHLGRQGAGLWLLGLLVAGGVSLVIFFNGRVWIWGWAITATCLLFFLLALIPSKKNEWGDW
ncbi:MAG: hypothetical protein DHS20C14_15940 [Phycisphaeraceae bacterium]|nr:MAG: hypothetical protein DHS20C14_15940 [Phycisphaeraceae bacterium]